LYFIYVAVLTLIVYVLFVPILIKPILMLSLILIFSMVAGGWLWTSFVLAPYYLHDRPDLGALNAVRQAYVDVRGYRLQLLKCDLPVMLAMVVLSVLPLMWMKGSSDGMERASAPEDMAVQAEAFEYGRRVSYDELRAMDVQGMQKDQFVREMLAFRQQEEALPSDVAYDEKAGHWEAILQQIEGSGMSQRSLRMLVVYAIFMFLVNILGMMLILAVHAEFYRHLSMDREAPGGEETGGGRLGGAGGGGGGFEPGGPRRCMSVDLDRHASLDLDGQINADGRQIDNSLGLEDMSDFMPEVKSLPDDHGIHDALASISEIKSLPDEHRINDALASMSEVKSLPDEHGISALASMLEAGLLSPEPVRKHGSVREGTDPGFRINF
ncbi:MAG: hypothetical protein FWC40_10085, partial [Proteobacteria bacterium]|nr:hypothetical protein [Pseudomonadota bacterium]